MRVLVLSGPNLNLLGTREPERYGTTTLSALEAMVREHAAALGIEITWLQSNHEGELIDAIQAMPGRHDGAIINLGGYTHTSIAIRDALLAVRPAFVEVHLTNLFAREAARHHSVSGDLALGVLTGFGPRGYLLALDALAAHLAS
ncbi:MAG TPA: type II 3-dehydroquinate dehydratase [Gemmatimonadales bacterium]|nr:type II 3-dehydroquinate dehydratase [Gemmatimonadales bacterium]